MPYLCLRGGICLFAKHITSAFHGTASATAGQANYALCATKTQYTRQMFTHLLT